MYGKEHIEWLAKNNLLESAKSAVPVLKKVFRECLDAKNEDVLIIGDQGFENRRIAAVLCGSYFLAARELGLNVGLVVQEPKLRKDEANHDVIDSLYKLRRESIAILSLSSKIGSIGDLGDSFRTYAQENMDKFISTMSLGKLDTGLFHFLIGAIDVDYNRLKEIGQRLKEQLDAAEEVHITTKAGTDLYMSIKGKDSKMNIGNYRNFGTGGNIPAGEVYTPPKWKHVDGTVVIDGSSACRDGTHLIKTPIKLTIKKDEVINIEGGTEAKKLEATLDWAHMLSKYPWGVKRVGELGIGINEKAKIVGATIVDEKTLGTAHIGIGSNHWFGGTIYAIIHLDQVFKDPQIEIDGKLLKII